MSKKSITVLLTLTAVLMSMTSAFAGDTRPPGHGNPGTPIDWEELRGRCENPRQYDVQAPPENIVVQCSDSHLTWLASAPGEVGLPAKRTVTTAVFAHKYFVNAEQDEIPVFSKTGSCHRFKEVEESITVERPLSCAEVIGMKITPAEFCVTVLDQAKGQDPKLVQRRETGRCIDTCDAGSIQPGKP